MVGVIFERIASGLLIVWLAATMAFLVLQVLPGDAILSQLTQSGASPEEINDRRETLGLADPIWLRYKRFVIDALQGNLGNSLISREPVTQAIARNLMPTLALATGALAVASLGGILLGVVGALNVPVLSVLAHVVMSIALSTPIYWTGTIAIFIFTAQLGLLPSAGAGRVSQLILPVAVLGFHTSGAIARVAQTNVSTVLDMDFIRTARAKGLHERRVILVHGLRAGLPPVISVIALQAGFLLGGTVITESLFVRPGIGRLLLDATMQQDYPIVQGVVIWSAMVYAVLNISSELLYRIFDPRVAL